MDFYRYHGLGNDYLVIDPNKTTRPISPESVQAICRPHFGEGSDGILYGLLFTDTGEIQLRIFNPDSSEAEKSGNGTRILARYLVDEGYRNSGELFGFHTLGDVVYAHVTDRRNKIVMDMGMACFLSTKIPVLGPEREVVDEPLTKRQRIDRHRRIPGESALCRTGQHLIQRACCRNGAVFGKSPDVPKSYKCTIYAGYRSSPPPN